MECSKRKQNRTSVMSAVGLLPMALEGFDIDNFLAGAAAMDERMRTPDAAQNAAMLLALMWYYAGNGKGEKDMVILPYKDRLALFSKYLQQLVMESLGKEKDLDGNIVHQGIAVYGNKGSTDQHAYVQQLRDGVLNFFVTFIEVGKDRHDARFEVDEGITSGDYLQGFLRGTRSALYESGRESITISIPEAKAFSIGALIALYERAVGFYASVVNINAYDQPGVEAGKKAATKLLQLQKQAREKLTAGAGKTTEEIARSINADPEEVFHALRHLASNDSLELQSAYITEFEGNEELKVEVKRLREMVSRLTSTVQKLSGGLGEIQPNVISYRASDFVEDLRKKIAQEFRNKRPEIKWDVQPGNAVLNIDPQLLQEAIMELFANAFQHDRGEGALVAKVTVDENQFIFTLHEPKERFELSTVNWGREPLRNISHGHYGLGLNRVRIIIEAHGGEMHAQYDPKSAILATTLTLPA